MQIIAINSVAEAGATDTYLVDLILDLDDGNGPFPAEYGLTPTDPEPFAQTVRDAVNVWLAAGNTATPYTPPDITEADVDAERDRRLMSGIQFSGTTFDTDEKSIQRITGAAALAGFAIANGALSGNYLWHGGATDFQWIAADNARVLMDAQTMFAFGQAVASWEAGHVLAARALKDQSPIPSNYANAVHWPNV